MVADTTMLTLGTNNGLLVCVSFGSPSHRYLSFLFHSFDNGRWEEQNNNQTTTECVVITMTATMLLRSLSAWHRQRSVVTTANVPVCDLCDVPTSSHHLAICHPTLRWWDEWNNIRMHGNHHNKRCNDAIAQAALGRGQKRADGLSQLSQGIYAGIGEGKYPTRRWSRLYQP